MKHSLRKTLLAVALIVALTASAFALFGCADKEVDPKVAGVPTLTDTRSTEAEMATITTLDNREVTYNKNTRKIVAMSNIGDLVAFGIRPVAAMTQTEIKAAYPEFFEGVATLEYTQPFDAEEVLSYHPELIFVYEGMDDDDIAKLSRIAPVIPLPRNEFDFGKRLGYIGEVLGMKENADKLIQYAADVKAESLEKISKLNLEGKTVSIFYDLMGGTIMVPPMDWWYFNKIVYDYMGMKQTEAAKNLDFESMMTPISNEKTREFEGDIVIYADLAPANGVPAVPEVIKQNPGWMVLTAVQEDRVGVIDASIYADKDVLYLAEQYSQLLTAFKKATEEKK